MSNKPLFIKATVRTDWDYDDIPEHAEFEIDESTAQSIVNLSRLVKDNGLHKAELFDYRAKWLNEDESEISSDADALNISETQYWFSTYIKHTNVEILTERQNIQELIDYFALESRSVSNKISCENKILIFVNQLARLDIWDFNDTNECDRPTEGWLDSHVTLMQTIETARSILEEDGPQGEMIANYVTEITVTDPDSQAPVDVAIYKDKTSGAMLGVDCSFLLTLADDDPVIEPFNGNEVQLIEGAYGMHSERSEQGQLELPE